MGSIANGGLKQTVGADPTTDHRKWRLLDDHGRQTWHYLESEEENKSWPQTFADKYFLNLPTVCLP